MPIRTKDSIVIQIHYDCGFDFREGWGKLYGVETIRLNEQVQRNIAKFPEDFMFQLTKEEFKNTKTQIATSSSVWGGWPAATIVFETVSIFY